MNNVSVVIVNWNRKDELKETIQSILSQPTPDMEIIVVDNCSSDGSQKMVKENFPQVILIELPNSQHGACESYNIGISKSKGEIVILLDNDVFLGENWIRKVLDKFREDPKLGAVASRVINYYTGDEMWGFEPYDVEYASKEFEPHAFIGCAAAVRKSVLDEVGYYPEEFYLYVNEADLCARIIAAGYKIKYYPDIIAYHKVSPVQRSSRRRLYFNTRNYLWYYWKYYPLDQALLATMARLTLSLMFAVRNRFLTTYLKAIIDAFTGFPQVLKKRQPVGALRKKYSAKSISRDLKIVYSP